jgi:hypothetical protein
MYEVLDLTYTKEEGQTIFRGTYEECEEFIKQQSECGCVSMYEIRFMDFLKFYEIFSINKIL